MINIRQAESGQSRSSDSGQALSVIILVMAVVLTVALSLVSRTISDISISKKEDDSSRAFSAAEAGVEQALLKGGTNVTPFQGNVTGQDSFSVTATPLSSGGTEYALPLLLAAGETAPIWLVDHADDGSLTCSALKPCFTGNKLKVCWGATGTQDNVPTTPAVEVSIVYLRSDTDLSTTRIARGAYDPYATRPDGNSFTKGSEGSCTIGTESYKYSRTVDLALLGVLIRPDVASRRGPQYLRFRMLYNTNQSHPVGTAIVGPGAFPIQGSKVVSSGTSGSATRSLEVYQLFADLPPIFDFAVFSGSGGIVK